MGEVHEYLSRPHGETLRANMYVYQTYTDRKGCKHGVRKLIHNLSPGHKSVITQSSTSPRNAGIQ